MRYRRIKELREDNDLKQREVATQLNIARSTYCGYENELRQIPIEVLIDIARFYGVSVDYLLGLTDEAKPYPPARRRNS